jgi:hypothetical protein
MRFSSAGELEWIKVFASSSNTQGNDFVKLPDGGYAIAGTANLDEFYLLLLDGEGNVRQEYRWGTPGRLNKLTAVAVATNGDLIIGGVTNDDGLADKNYFARVKLAPLSVSKPDDFRQNGITVFPNPVSSYCEVSFGSVTGDVKVEIIDVKGEIVKQAFQGDIFGSEHTARLDLEDLPVGHYFIRIKHSGGIALSPVVRY